jgi:hypothetical protein
MRTSRSPYSFISHKPRAGAYPQRFGQLVAGDVAVAVDHQVGEQQPTLATRQAGIQPLAVALDSQRPADLDPHRWRGRQGHANILALGWAGSQSRRHEGETDPMRMRVRGSRR